MTDSTCIAVIASGVVVSLILCVETIRLFIFRTCEGLRTRRFSLTTTPTVLCCVYGWLVLPMYCTNTDPASTIGKIVMLIRSFLYYWFLSSCVVRLWLFHFEWSFLHDVSDIKSEPSRAETWYSQNKQTWGNLRRVSVFVHGFSMTLFAVNCVLLFVAPQNSSRTFFSISGLFLFSSIAFLVYTVRDHFEVWRVREELILIGSITCLLFLSYFFVSIITQEIVTLMALEYSSYLWAGCISTFWVWRIIPPESKLKQDDLSLEELSARSDTAVGGTKSSDAPLAYILTQTDGFESFQKHCLYELNIENLLFLADVAFFKGVILDSIVNRHEKDLRRKTDSSVKSAASSPLSRDNPVGFIPEEEPTQQDSLRQNTFTQVVKNILSPRKKVSIRWTPQIAATILREKGVRSTSSLPHPAPMREKALHIYNTYVVEGSQLEINVPSATRVNLHHFFVDPEFNPTVRALPASTTTMSPSTSRSRQMSKFAFDSETYRLFHIFDGAWTNIFYLVTNNVVPRYRLSDEYRKNWRKKLFERYEKEGIHEIEECITRRSEPYLEPLQHDKLVVVPVEALNIAIQLGTFGRNIGRERKTDVV